LRDLRYLVAVKILVLDTTELRQDWTFAGLKSQLLAHAVGQGHLEVAVPAVTVEELVAHHRRRVDELTAETERVRQNWRRLGAESAIAPRIELTDYREFLAEQFEEFLGFTLLPWPNVSHADMVERAVNRTPPFDEKGGGYRDALIWASVLELAAQQRDVVLVSADNAFRGAEDQLAQTLAEEVQDLSGTVELVRNLAPWLVQVLPWAATNIEEGLWKARDQQFAEFLMTPEITQYYLPRSEELTFEPEPFSLEFRDYEWEGPAVRTTVKAGDNGAHLAEYLVQGRFAFVADCPEETEFAGEWELSRLADGVVRVTGTAALTGLFTVLHAPHFGMGVSGVVWRDELYSTEADADADENRVSTSSSPATASNDEPGR